MKTRSIYFAISILLITICSCAPTKQFVSIPDQSKEVENYEMGRIYVLRPTSFGSAISMTVTENNIAIGRTGPKGYLCWEREPGETIVDSQAENNATINVDVQKGSVTYILQSVQMGFLTARNKLKLLTEEEGKNKLKKCKPPKNAR